MTFQAGLLPIIGFGNKINLDALLNDIKSTDGDRTKVTIQNAIKMVAIGFAAGATALTKVVSMWNDSVLANLSGVDRVPHDSNLGKAFKRQNKQTIADIESLPAKMESVIRGKDLTSFTMRMLNRKEELIDIDGTDFISYGNQEGAVKGYNHKKKGANCYQGLLAFDSASKTVKLGWLRSGNTHCANGIIDFTRQLNSYNPKITKFIRMDSGFFSGELLDELEEQGNGYLIKCPLTSSIKKRFHQEIWNFCPGKPGKKEWQETTFYHQFNGWKKAREITALRIKIDEYHDKNSLFPDYVIEEYAYFCYINTREMSPWTTHCFYGQRATCENYIEELKNQVNLGKIKSHSFDATSLFFHCAILAYNLMRWMTICTGKKKLISWEISSLRCFLIRIAGLLRKPSGQLVLEISNRHMYQNELNQWMSYFPSQ